jgi:hypothetical protein
MGLSIRKRRPSRSPCRFAKGVVCHKPDVTTAFVGRTSSQMPYRSNRAASDVDLARFDLRIIRAMQSSGHPRHDGWVRGVAVTLSGEAALSHSRGIFGGHPGAGPVRLLRSASTESSRDYAWQPKRK